MASEEHIRILAQGVQTWNQWRADQPEIEPDLSETDFTKADFRGMDLRRTSFFGSNLQQADLRDTNLLLVDFFGANLRTAHLTGARNLTTGQIRSAFTDAATVLPEPMER